MIFRTKAAGLSVIVASILTACGGGGGSSSSSPTSFTGTVIDGYIEGAQVCLDLNADLACGAGEPTATSKVGGTYSLDTTGLSTAQIKAAHLLTIVPSTAKDADDAGKTLAEAGKAAFNMMAPASAFMAANGTLSSAVISPLTTLVSHDMMVNSKPLTDAVIAVRTLMGLANTTDLTQDFVANLNGDLTQQARMVAAIIGKVKAAVPVGTTDRDAQLAALSYLHNNMAALQIAVASATSGTMSEKVAAALATQALKPIPADLITEAQKTTSSNASELTAMLADGIYDGCGWLNLDCAPPMYVKVTAANGQWQTAAFTLDADTRSWISQGGTTNSSQTLTTSGSWISITNAGTYTADDQGGGTLTETASGRSFRLSARTVDVSGKQASSIAGLTLASGVDFTFGPGSKLYWMQDTPMTDTYNLFTGYQISSWNMTTSTSTNLTSINELIAAYPTNRAPTFVMGYDHLNFTFDTAPTNSLTGTISLYSSVGISPPKIGTAAYEIKTVFGQQILIFKSPIPGEVGANVTFAATNGKLYGGRFNPKGVTHEWTPSFNKAAINSMKGTYSLPVVLN